MRLIPGAVDMDKIADMTAPEILQEASRLANNLQITGMEYTAAVLQRLIDLKQGAEK